MAFLREAEAFLQTTAAHEDLLMLGTRASRIRRQLHPDSVVTYTKAARIECATAAGTNADMTRILEAVAEAERRGATGIVLASTPAVSPLLACEEGCRAIHASFPHLAIDVLATEILAALARDAELTPALAITRLQAAGLTGIAPSAEPASLELDRAAHQCGVRTRALVLVQAGESRDALARRIDTLAALQEETGGFISVAVTASEARSTYLSDELTAVEFLTALATARIALPSIPHLESDWPAQGLKLLQMALRFGANDAGSVHLDRSIASSGPDTPTEEDLRRIIRDAGYTPVERAPDYSTCYLV